MDTIKEWVNKTILYHSPITEQCPYCHAHFTYEGFCGNSDLEWLLEHLRDEHS